MLVSPVAAGCLWDEVGFRIDDIEHAGSLEAATLEQHLGGRIGRQRGLPGAIIAGNALARLDRMARVASAPFPGLIRMTHLMCFRVMIQGFMVFR